MRGGPWSSAGRAWRGGLAANSVIAAELVTPDGDLVRADADHEPDLFWAVRGGGGIGVVTALEMRLYPVRELYAGDLFVPIQRAAEVLHAWREWTATVPDEITTIGHVVRLPPLPQLPEPLRGRALAMVEAAYLGDAGTGAELTQPLRRLGPQLDTFATIPPPALGQLHMDPTSRRPFKAKPGTGTGECGTGIPAGTKLAFNVLYASDPVIFGEELTAWASDAKKVGITITLQSGTFNHVLTVVNDPGSPKTINQWAVAAAGGFYLPNHPTTLGIFCTGGFLNVGFYHNPQADKLITASITSGNPSAVKAEASYLTQQQPSLFQPSYDFIAVWKDTGLRPARRHRGDDPVRPQRRAGVPDRLTGPLQRAGWRIGHQTRPARRTLPA